MRKPDAFGWALIACFAFWTLVIWLILGTSVRAQTQAVQTLPSKGYSGDASSTIAVTNTFQTIWNSFSPTNATQRKGCLIINTSTDLMWVYFGADGDTPAKAKSVPLNPAASSGELGGWVSCATGAGSALQDHVWITGTSGDAYVAKQQ
jgi:hypothetical protein